jgi:hypothetical protein
MVSTDHFRQELQTQLGLAAERGGKDLIVGASELYNSVTKLPVFDPWMIFCCNAMRTEMSTDDHVITEHAAETRLTVQYRLPRNDAASPASKLRR